MLARLSIRDIVLIERLDIEFSRGLAVLTGETGAGKSILLDAFALALGGRGDSGLVRHGAEQGQVTATFDVPKGHPAAKILSENGLDDTGEMILRRVQLADGRTRAFINDQSISVQTLKAVGAALVEIHGQHDERALVDASTHRQLLDAFAGLEKEVAALETLWEARRTANTALDEHRASMERAAREADYLRHAADELKAAEAEGRRGDGARRAPHHHDAGREDRKRPARGAGGGRRPPFAGAGAGGRRTPPRTPRRQFARAGRAGGEGDRYRDQRAGRGRPASQRSPGRGRFRSRRAGAHRGAAVCAARRLAQIFDAGRWARGARRQIRRRRGADRCRRGPVEEAGSRRCRGRPALWRGGREAVCGPQQVRREAQQGRQCRTGAAKTRTRKIHDAGRDRREVAGAAGHRPRRVLGADQSRHQGGPADEGRFRRRAVAVPAGAQGGAVGPRFGAHAGVRRNRYRRRRRGGGRDRRAAVRGWPARSR